MSILQSFPTSFKKIPRFNFKRCKIFLINSITLVPTQNFFFSNSFQPPLPLPLSTTSIEENRDFYFSIASGKWRGGTNAPPPRLRSLIIPAAGEGYHGSTYSTGQVTIEQLYFSSCETYIQRAHEIQGLPLSPSSTIIRNYRK